MQALRLGLQRQIAIVLKLLLATAALLGCADLRNTRGNAANLDIYELGMLPKLSEFRRLGKRPDEPFVMINLLNFRAQAKASDFEGLSGEQAYHPYLKGMTRAQSDIGSRLIWAGRIQHQFIGNSEPAFEIVALLEYASPSTFRQAVRPIRASGLNADTLVDFTH